MFEHDISLDIALAAYSMLDQLDPTWTADCEYFTET